MVTNGKLGSAGRLLPGRPMKYDIFIKTLDLNELYSPHMVAKHGEYLGFFKIPPFTGEDAFRKARNSLSGFCRLNLPVECDCVVETPGYKSTKSWYGWRWKRALSPTFFTKKEWRAIIRAEKHYFRRQRGATRKRMLLHVLHSKRNVRILVLVTVVVGFIISHFHLIPTTDFDNLAVREFQAAKVWQVWKEEGPSAFLAYLKDPRTNEEKFMQAWGYYNQGKLNKANQLIAPLLKIKTNSKTKGNAFFLAGLVASYSRTSKTMDYMAHAVEIYSEKKALNSLFITYLTMADQELVEDDLWLAKYFVKKAKDLHASNPNLCFYHEILSKCFLREGKYEQALHASQKSLALSEGKDINATARALSDMGLLYILLGRYDEALSKSIESEKLLLEAGADNLYYYNKINFFVLAKCTGQNAEPYKNLILERVATNGDLVLQDELNRAETYACPIPGSN